MRFDDFARLHGLRINNVIVGRWVAVPTDDHPRKRNGRYKFLGSIGWVQNWATMPAPEIWRGESEVSLQNVRRRVEYDNHEREVAAVRAASKAGWIMHQTQFAPHPYLAKKGFPDEPAHVWNELLVVPMRMGAKLIGCQLIDNEGNKKFLHGQRTKGAMFTMDARGTPIFCEGYATALSVRSAMKAMKVRYTIHVAFSAGNLEGIARGIEGGLVVADNDPNGVGERAARNAGKPYWISDTVGEDFNDYHQRVGLFKASMSLKRLLFSSSSAEI